LDINPIQPFQDETLTILFKLYSGNLRGILRSLECAVLEIVTSQPRTITPNMLKFSLFKFAQNRFLSKFTRENTNALKILKRILEKKETTNKLLSEHFKMKPQNVSSALTTLREVGAIRLSREEGRSKYYVPSQEALWLLLEPSPNWEGQTFLL
ncbi:MAG: helix-turn-helix transcriptional regulator, partial [Candidatus Diapherotrites archaeon]|nr:helix-turn-helix transcriptional regulator [Candidatus Diapherotrites archaeon]